MSSTSLDSDESGEFNFVFDVCPDIPAIPAYYSFSVNDLTSWRLSLQNSTLQPFLKKWSSFDKLIDDCALYSDPKTAIKYSKSEFWYGQQQAQQTLSRNSAVPKHSATTENINKKDRPRSATVEASERYANIARFSTPAPRVSIFEYDLNRFKKPVVERGLVRERAQVRNIDIRFLSSKSRLILKSESSNLLFSTKTIFDANV